MKTLGKEPVWWLETKKDVDIWVYKQKRKERKNNKIVPHKFQTQKHP
jgi:plasmid maintenance system antidote protein VapI